MGWPPRAAREPRIMDKPKVNFECAPTMRTDRESWMGRTRDARKEDAIPGQSGWPPRTHRGRVVRPDTLGGKACWAYTSTVPVERSGIRAAHRGLDAPVRRHPFRRLKSHWSTPKIRVRVTTGCCHQPGTGERQRALKGGAHSITASTHCQGQCFTHLC